MPNIVVEMDGKEILVEYEKGTPMKKVEAAIRERFKKAPLEPIEFKPATLDIAPLKITVDQPKIQDVKHHSTVDVKFPEAKIMAKNLLQSQTANTDTINQMQEMITDMIEQKIEFPAPVNWEFEFVRNSHGHMTGMKCKVIN